MLCKCQVSVSAMPMLVLCRCKCHVFVGYVIVNTRTCARTHTHTLPPPINTHPLQTWQRVIGAALLASCLVNVGTVLSVSAMSVGATTSFIGAAFFGVQVVRGYIQVRLGRLALFTFAPSVYHSLTTPNNVSATAWLRGKARCKCMPAVGCTLCMEHVG
jgi:hypothetical protein